MWSLNCWIVMLVDGYLDTSNLWYIKTTAEFLTLLEYAGLMIKKIKKIDINLLRIIFDK